MFAFDTKTPFLMIDIDGTLVQLRGDWARVREMSKPFKDVYKASENAVKTGDKKFFEELHKLEIIQTPIPLKLIGMVQQMTCDKFLVTNNSTATGWYVNQMFELNCKDVVGIDMVSIGKPSSEGIDLLIKKHGLDRRAGYYIGNEHTDKIAAESASLSFIDSFIFNG
jgi:phosphoglycolate phosphatase-like HAD superfamily hydrolase